jgi:phenylpropionate dioxygenase-like ring-hydroxylating dioxygenase large terminal subunit
VFQIDEMMDLSRGVVDNRLFADDEIHAAELERVFGRTWLFVTHETAIPNPGDYVIAYMGEDSVVVTRDPNSEIRVLLNKCRHRGNKVCLWDRGNTKVFTCSYHGWSYDTAGRLVGVPFHKEAFHDSLDTAQWGLVQVPRVETYGGLIFASWDEDIVSLSDYLGDMKWYLENFFLAEDEGGLELIPGVQRYRLNHNWKGLAENFTGDHYHFRATHASFIKVLNDDEDYRMAVGPSSAAKYGSGAGDKVYEVTVGHQDGVPHSLGQLGIGSESPAIDLERAGRLGPEALQWVKDRRRRLEERLRDVEIPAYGFSRGHLFPNLSFFTISTLHAHGLMQWQPRGVNESEVWQWVLVERNMPSEVREHAVWSVAQTISAAGLIAPDDNENFERITENVQTPFAAKVPATFVMGLGEDPSLLERDFPGQGGLPGIVGPRFTEINQREFYRYWGELMAKGQNGA